MRNVLDEWNQAHFQLQEAELHQLELALRGEAVPVLLESRIRVLRDLVDHLHEAASVALADPGGLRDAPAYEEG